MIFFVPILLLGHTPCISRRSYECEQKYKKGMKYPIIPILFVRNSFSLGYLDGVLQLSGRSVGLCINHRNPEHEELYICYSSQCCPKCLNFCIEWFSKSICCAVYEEVKYLVVMLLSSNSYYFPWALRWDIELLWQQSIKCHGWIVQRKNKLFRESLWGVADKKFFLFRIANIYVHPHWISIEPNYFPS